MGMRDREDTGFDSAGDRCAAWLYRPDGDGPHPCVVLAHGFGGTREGRLWAYAERFAAAGIAAVVFDYRHFGDSEGEPRQLLSISRQLDDWRAAIAFARSLEGVDRERIALWGTSFSGGHVVRLAAEDDRIAAVIAQAPFTDGANALRAAGVKGSLRLTAGGLLDGMAAITGGEPLRIPIVAPPGKGAAMSQPGAYDGYRALFDPPSSFRNEFCARAAMALASTRPPPAPRRSNARFSSARSVATRSPHRGRPSAWPSAHRRARPSTTAPSGTTSTSTSASSSSGRSSIRPPS